MGLEMKRVIATTTFSLAATTRYNMDVRKAIQEMGIEDPENKPEGLTGMPPRIEIVNRHIVITSEWISKKFFENFVRKIAEPACDKYRVTRPVSVIYYP